MKVNLQEKVAQFETNYQREKEKFFNASDKDKALEAFFKIHQTKKNYDSNIATLTRSLEE